VIHGELTGLMVFSRHEKLAVAITLLHIVAAREILNNSSTMDLAVLFFLVSYLIGMAFLGYFCIIADPSKSRLANLFTVEGPARIQKLVSDWIGEENANRLSALAGSFFVCYVHGHRLWLMGAIFLLYLPLDLMPVRDISLSYQKVLGYIVFVVCVISWSFASRAVSRNHHRPRPWKSLTTTHMMICYSSRTESCPTVGIRKLARSKFDRFQSYARGEV
jgi:hypothetical protein